MVKHRADDQNKSSEIDKLIQAEAQSVSGTARDFELISVMTELKAKAKDCILERISLCLAFLMFRRHATLIYLM